MYVLGNEPESSARKSSKLPLSLSHISSPYVDTLNRDSSGERNHVIFVFRYMFSDNDH